MVETIAEWKKELNQLIDETGTTLKDVCEYLGVTYKTNVSFYYKKPKKREVYIGIGMAFGQNIDVINRWIKQYGGKKKLYSKEALSDLIWIYLINCSYKQASADHIKPCEGINYYNLYDKCQKEVQKTYIALWNEYVMNSLDTAQCDEEVRQLEYDPAFEGIKGFVAENMDSFKTAYARPRRMLFEYVNEILETYTRVNGGKKTPVSFLRGYLDDSMINYITGNYESIHVVDLKTRDRIINEKAVPKLKRSHIAICLALGMVTDEINEYLDKMGYMPLDENDIEEAYLIGMLNTWDKEHPNVQAFKKKHFSNKKVWNEKRVDEKDLQAVSDMLMLRSDLSYEYSKKKVEFPYLKN